MSGAKHPGQTPAQRRALDEIGCGNQSPIMTKATCDALLRRGLIIEIAAKEIPSVGRFTMKVRQFMMPAPVHIRWCEAMAAQEKESHDQPG